MEPDHRPTVSYVNKILTDTGNSMGFSSLEPTEHPSIQMTSIVTNSEVAAVEIIEEPFTACAGPSSENFIVLDALEGAEGNIEVYSLIFN